MTDRIPIVRAHQLADLDLTDVLEGYRDGYAGECEPGNNRSLSFWHGWRNGLVDGGHRQKDDAQAELARDYLTPMP